MFQEYRELLSHTATKFIVTAKLAVMLPDVALALPLVYLIQKYSGSYTIAAIAMTLYTLFALVGAPVISSYITKTGRINILVGLSVVHAVCLSSFVWLLPDWDSWQLVLICITGLANPPLLPFLRHGWQRIITNEKLTHGFENATTELMFILGPSIAAFAVAIAHPALFIYIGSILPIFACIIWVHLEQKHLPEINKIEDETHQKVNSWRIAAPMLVAFLWVFNWGVFDLAAVAAATDFGHTYYAGIWIAALSAGGLVGGILYGLVPWSGKNLRLEISLSMLLYSGMVLALFWGEDHPYAIIPLLMLCGLASAPTYAGIFIWADRLVQKHRRPKAYALIGSALGAGGAIGPLPAGYFADQGNYMIITGIIVAGAILAAIVTLCISESKISLLEA